MKYLAFGSIEGSPSTSAQILIISILDKNELPLKKSLSNKSIVTKSSPALKAYELLDTPTSFPLSLSNTVRASIEATRGEMYS